MLVSSFHHMHTIGRSYTCLVQLASMDAIVGAWSWLSSLNVLPNRGSVLYIHCLLASPGKYMHFSCSLFSLFCLFSVLVNDFCSAPWIAQPCNKCQTLESGCLNFHFSFLLPTFDVLLLLWSIKLSHFIAMFYLLTKRWNWNNCLRWKSSSINPESIILIIKKSKQKHTLLKKLSTFFSSSLLWWDDRRNENKIVTCDIEL